MKFALSPADKKLLDEVFEPQLVRGKSKELGNYLEAIEDLSKMNQEITTRGKHTGAVGFSADFNLQKVAHIPLKIAHIILRIDPDILTDKKKFYAFLKTPMGRACDYRRKSVPRAM